jgi:hypothetical protein
MRAHMRGPHLHVPWPGEWVADKMEGQGIYTYKGGDIYRGGFKAGKKDGCGVYVYKVGLGDLSCWLGTYSPPKPAVSRITNPPAPSPLVMPEPLPLLDLLHHGTSGPAPQ